MEKNYISKTMDTYFYIGVINHTYGVVVNIKEAKDFDNIRKKFLTKRKEQIEAWKKEWEEEN